MGVQLIQDALGSSLTLSISLSLHRLNVCLPARETLAQAGKAAAWFGLGDHHDPVVAHRRSLLIQQIRRERLGLRQRRLHHLSTRVIRAVAVLVAGLIRLNAADRGIHPRVHRGGRLAREPMTISKTGQTRDSVVEAVERRLVVFLPGIQPPVVARRGHEGEQTQVVR